MVKSVRRRKETEVVTMSKVTAKLETCQVIGVMRRATTTITTLGCHYHLFVGHANRNSALSPVILFSFKKFCSYAAKPKPTLES